MLNSILSIIFCIIILLLLLFGWVKLFMKIASNDKWTKIPLKDWEIEQALKYKLYNGDINKIKENVADTRLALSHINQHSINKNALFTYNLYFGDDCVKIYNSADFNTFIEQLCLQGIPYYSYRLSRTYDNENHFDNNNHYYHKTYTDYFISVDEKDFDRVQQLFDSLDLDGNKFYYYEEDGEICYELI